MAGEWPMLSLRDAGVTLIDCDHRTPPPSETGFPYVAIPQLRNGRIDLTGVRRITREHFTEWTRKAKPTANDVVLSRRCNPGETAFVPAGLEFALGQNLVLLRADGEKVYPPFLRWLVRGPEWWGQIGKFRNVGAVFDSLKCADVPKFELHIPPIDEQRAIAHILGSLDDKIELNRRMNQTLEAIARAIFKSWFVDFDPVRAKASGEPPESICRRLGLTPDLLALFPERLVDAELGEIPEGWGVCGLDTFASLRTASTSPIAQPNCVFEHYSIPAFDSEQMPAYELGSTIKSNKYVVSSRAVLVSKLNPATPRIWLPTVKTEHAVCSTELMQFVPLSDWGRSYLYLMMRSEPMQVEILKRVTGSTGSRQRAQPSQIAKLPVVLPPHEVLKAFDLIITPMLDHASMNRDQSQTLASLRDAVLPKLMSGELRVPMQGAA